MTAAPIQPTLTPAQYHRNAQLFSDHYLDHILPGRSDWQMLVVQGQAVREQIRLILADFKPSNKEAQTEDDLVKPVLKALGHTFEVQPSLKVPDGTRVPDYVLYNAAAARTALKGKVLDDVLLKGMAFGVADAKYWDRPLDKALTGPGDAFNNKNPAYQIAFYVQHAGVAWGVLTNGRLWRLVHQDTAHKLDRYYEIDLPAVVEREDAFAYFYAFFRRQAFDPGPLSLDNLLAASADYARQVGEGLKTQVYEALRHLAQGFLDYAPNHLETSAEALNTIYDHSLIVLYRLLFVFYAEARELLPLADSTQYRDKYSLRAITRTVVADLATTGLLPDSATVWPKLQQLFKIINAGSPPLKVATFNGGLFDPARYPFLERHTVGDAHLEAALDRLARVKGDFIDYRDLSERHLGTIYEGLLEHHLQPIDPAGGWTVDLFNDRGERKRSGSYYTPDAIVKYIVEQTVGPALQDALAPIPESDLPRRVDAVLAVNCLDPAMGSGHFLVEVVEYIARCLVDMGAQGAAPGESDLAYWKRRVAQSCVYGVDLNPLAVDLAKLSLWLSTAARDRPLSFLDHHLRVGNSLVGSRLSDPDLTGFAKPVRSTHAQTRAKKAAAAAEAAGQTSMLDDDAFRQSLSLAVDAMWLIEGINGLTLAEVKQQEQLYLNLRDALNQRYGALADLATARRFGIAIDADTARLLADQLAGRSVVRFPKFEATLAQVTDLAQRHRFFHWELEFPEVFFDKHGYGLGEKAGFDVVLGNPPYVRQEALAPYKSYFAEVYPEVYHGTADLFVYFFAQGIRGLQQNGRLSYIASNSWLRANYATPLRKFLREKTTVETIVDLGDNRVFADAPDVYPAIIVAKNLTPNGAHEAGVAAFGRGEGVECLSERISQKVQLTTMADQPDTGWQLESGSNRRLLQKLLKAGQPLGAFVDQRIYRGILTGLNTAFVIDAQTRQEVVAQDASASKRIRAIVGGEDLRPWYQVHGDKWLIFFPSGWTAEVFGSGHDEQSAWREFQLLFPSLANHLRPYRDAAMIRLDKGEYWWELRSCDYYDEFAQPKILWPDICKFPRFSHDTDGLFLSNTGYIMLPGYSWLLGILASRAMWYQISKTAIALGERAGLERYRLIDQYVRPLSVPNPDDPEQKQLGELVQLLTSDARLRYTLHRQARHRILTDLGKPGGKLNLKLTAWWELTFPALRSELQKVFGQDIPVKQRDEWEAWLGEQRAEHERLTAGIVALETRLNAHVYELFDLTPAEIKIIEESTKYKYGEV